jgi:DNA-binding MarR family transcriptional regulator
VLKYSDTILHKFALSTIKFAALQVLAINQGGMMPSDLACWLGRERQSVTTLVQRLSKDGLVSVKRGFKDGRMARVTLTDKGIQVLSLATPTAIDIVTKSMSTISKSDLAVMAKLLSTMRENAENGLKVAEPI